MAVLGGSLGSPRPERPNSAACWHLLYVGAPCWQRLSVNFLVMIFFGCIRPTEQPLEVPVEAETKSSIERETRFLPGPDIEPSLALLAWFEGPGQGRSVRIPVVVTSSPLGVSGGHVGMAPGPSEQALRLRLDDGAMGIGLHDRLGEHCDGAPTCAVWLEGRWGETVPMPPELSGGAGEHAFSVRDVVGPVRAEDIAKVQVAVD